MACAPARPVLRPPLPPVVLLEAMPAPSPAVACRPALADEIVAWLGSVAAGRRFAVRVGPNPNPAEVGGDTPSPDKVPSRVRDAARPPPSITVAARPPDPGVAEFALRF